MKNDLYKLSCKNLNFIWIYSVHIENISFISSDKMWEESYHQVIPTTTNHKLQMQIQIQKTKKCPIIKFKNKHKISNKHRWQKINMEHKNNK